MLGILLLIPFTQNSKTDGYDSMQKAPVYFMLGTLSHVNLEDREIHIQLKDMTLPTLGMALLQTGKPPGCSSIVLGFIPLPLIVLPMAQIC